MAILGLSHMLNTKVGNDLVHGVSGGETTLSGVFLSFGSRSNVGITVTRQRDGARLHPHPAPLNAGQRLDLIYQLFDKAIVLYEGQQIYYGPTDRARKFWTMRGFFARIWRESAEYQVLREIEDYNAEYSLGGEALTKFKTVRQLQQSKLISAQLPYTISVCRQIALCMDHRFQRLVGNLTSFLKNIMLMHFIIPQFAEAISSMICDLPANMITGTVVNMMLYFMTNLRRTLSAFFIFYLFSMVCMLTMSMIFGTITAMSRSLVMALTPAVIFIPGLIMYTGFTVLHVPDLTLYAVMVNKFVGRVGEFFPAGPTYTNISVANRICATTGTQAGLDYVGKTTLLDVLETRTTMGIITGVAALDGRGAFPFFTGDMLINGRQWDQSFQRKTGYVQQQDLHLVTSTVRESLIFSALLRQHKCVPKEEKLAYVEEVIALLEMESYASAVVGVPGKGLNVEQRKHLTIAVELVAKPELLVFFASAILMQEFDRLLFLYAVCHIPKSLLADFHRLFEVRPMFDLVLWHEVSHILKPLFALLR
ncbi:hypothetical protein DFH07DRAFT_966437 [Mycena maculata]|uniref:ABC transporter n=1 Tax=Mycena maculata TaxID=230809 RepID=A0AAD7I8T6_9AGAR|nr:hypothetical protein DFH07DRAFT_966437 [Mycena maculata]